MNQLSKLKKLNIVVNPFGVLGLPRIFMGIPTSLGSSPNSYAPKPTTKNRKNLDIIVPSYLRLHRK